MNREKLKSTLEAATNIAVLLVAVAALCAFAINYLLRPSPPNLQIGLERGRLLGGIPKLDYSASRRTLLIVLNTKCAFCRESIPFYQGLVAANHQSEKDLRIVALFPNKTEDVASYVNDNDLSLNALAEVQLEALRIAGTPTIVLVNNKGEVNDFWIGKLGGAEEKQLMQSLVSDTLY